MSKWIGMMMVLVVSLVLSAAPAWAATITVNDMGDNTNDDSVVTLREALISCNTDVDLNDEVAGQRSGGYVTGGGASGDVIVFDASLYGQTNNLADAVGFRSLEITDDVRITGDDTDNIVIRPSNNYYRLVTVSQSATVIIEGMTIRDGSFRGLNYNEDTYDKANGGAVWATNNTSLTFRHCLFANNKQSSNGGSGYGGAIYTRGDLTVENCEFDRQRAYDNSKNSLSGLNLYVLGTVSDQLAVSLANVTMVGNDTGTLNVKQGAVLAGEYCDVTMVSCTFTNFPLDSSGSTGEFGGGLIYLNNGDLALDSCLLADGRAESLRLYGAGICHLNGTLTLLNSTIRNCKAGNDRQGYGGAIYHTDGAVIVSNCTIEGNSAACEGGRYPAGGGIWCGANSDLDVIDSYIGDNTCGATDSVGTKQTRGGGVYFAGGAGYTARFDNVTFSGNVMEGTNANTSGGGALAVLSGDAVLRNCTVVRNAAHYQGGGVYRVGGLIYLYNCIVAGNASSDPELNDLAGYISEAQSCIIGDAINVGTIAVSVGNITGPDLSGNPKVGVDLTSYYSDAVTDVAVEDYAAARAHLDNVLTALKMTTAAGTTEGGDTAYHALDPASVAVDAGDDDYADGTLGGVAILYDQRGVGFARAVETVDIGAYELFIPPAGTVVSIK
ncbi:MAG: hypothetical protein ISS31_10205 [Kiritimatiellae bacterium]|nr:hypothetical protein [Kiritimatiellia bacterium]